MKRLTPASVTLIMFAVVGVLIAAYVAKGLFAVEKEAPRVVTRNVPMAIADLEVGTVITEAHIGVGPVAIDRLKPDMLLSNRVIVGRVVKEKIDKATPIRAEQLYQPGKRPPLEVGEGMRAVSVSVGESVQIVDGLITPGEFVDVQMTVITTNGDERYQGGLTLTLFRGVRVIAINQNYRSASIERGGNTVTLELTPEQANIMILAREKGLITLTFNPEGRGNGVVAVSSADRATLDEILGLEPLPKPEPPFRTEVYRRSGRTELRFRDGRQLRGDAFDDDAYRTRSSSTSSGDDRNRDNAPSDNSIRPDQQSPSGPTA